MDEASQRPGRHSPALRVVASLWFAAVLLILLGVAMACATMYETVHGRQQALLVFYSSWWFQTLLGLLAVNVAAAVVVRYPFSRRQAGFVLTHGSILLVLAGAFVTRHWGIDGQIAIPEGQSTKEFSVPQDVLTLVDAETEDLASIELNPPVRATNRPAAFTKAPTVALDGVRAEVRQYLADSVMTTEVLDDGQTERAAVEVSFSEDGKESPKWIFAGQTARVGEVEVAFRRVAGTDELNRLLAGVPSSQPASSGIARIEHDGRTYDLSVESCMAATQPVGDTGFGVRVLRYLPHAFVGQGNRLVDDPTRPLNPAIEVELSGKGAVERRLAFSQVPEFDSMHGKSRLQGVKLTFVSAAAAESATPVEVLSGPEDSLHVRFGHGPNRATAKLAIGTPVDTPWPLRRFSVLRLFKHAKQRRSIGPADLMRENATPAVFIRISDDQTSSEMWLQKGTSQGVTVAGKRYGLIYDDKSLPLAFDLQLDHFHIGRYPGTSQPRSFQSLVTVTDPAGGVQQQYLISMNSPLRYGGYTFYQSSYHQDRKGMVSVLSVAWDPGKPIAFLGYGLMMLGMLWVLINRFRKQAGRPATAARET